MILVTGAAGLVGYPLVLRLVERGEAVIATDLRQPDSPLPCPFLAADLRDRSAVTALFAAHAITGVVHGGAISGSMVAPNDPFRVMSVNVTGTIALAEAGRLAGVERFIGLSSIGVYGDQPTLDPVREDSPRPATDIYSCSKIAMESVLFGYRQNFGLKATVLRMSSVFGPGRRTPCFIRGLLVAALEGRTATVSADAERRRQFLFVDDAVASVLAALDAPALPEFAYNVTGGTWLTEAEVLAAARRAVPALRGDAADIPPLGLDGRTGPLDMTLARRDLGYAPQTTIEAGIARYAAFLADP